MGTPASTHAASILNDGRQVLAPSCVVKSGFQTFSPPILSNWSVGSVVWSDRSWTYTHIGSFTTTAFQFKFQTSVDSRKASYTFSAPVGQEVEIYVLGETRRVHAPWAFSAGEPDLDETWRETCETLPGYEAGVTCHFDFCRSRTLHAGETVTINATAGGKLDVFVKVVSACSSVDWQKPNADLAEAHLEDHARPHLRSAPEGLRTSCRGRGHRGISPPPADGWIHSKTGWDTHKKSQNWLRKVSENDAKMFFYLPEETHWVEMPSRGFMHIDMCLDAIAFLMDVQSLHRQSFFGWKAMVHAVKTFRRRLHVLAPSDNDQEELKDGGSFPVKTAFIPRSALKSGSKRHRSPTPKREVTFSPTVQTQTLPCDFRIHVDAANSQV